MAGVMRVSCTAAGGPYSAFKVITGAQTTGIVQQSGSSIYSTSLSPNVQYYSIVADPGNGTKKAFTGDNKVTTTNGTPLTAGAQALYRAGDFPRISLIDKWWAVDTDATIVILEWG